MNTDSHGFSGKEDDLTHEIIGSAFEVLNTLGVGLLEKPYENALAIELSLRGIEIDQQKVFPVHYKNHEVGTYIPDLIAKGRVVIDTKVIDKITNVELAQMLNYLRITRLQVGLILNFKRPKLEFERIVLDS